MLKIISEVCQSSKNDVNKKVKSVENGSHNVYTVCPKNKIVKAVFDYRSGGKMPSNQDCSVDTETGQPKVLSVIYKLIFLMRKWDWMLRNWNQTLI